MANPNGFYDLEITVTGEDMTTLENSMEAYNRLKVRCGKPDAQVKTVDEFVSMVIAKMVKPDEGGIVC